MTYDIWYRHTWKCRHAFQVPHLEAASGASESNGLSMLVRVPGGWDFRLWMHLKVEARQNLPYIVDLPTKIVCFPIVMLNYQRVYSLIGNDPFHHYQ